MPAVNYEELARFYDALVTDDSDLPYFRDLARQADGPVAEFMAQEGSPYRSPKTASTSPASTRPRRCSRFCGRSWLQEALVRRSFAAMSPASNLGRSSR